MLNDVSVVIPTYNRQKFIEETLDSVMAQTLPPKEIIVVDDCSNDETEKAIKKFSHKITYIKNEKNQGVCFSRNVGIRASSSNLIALLDSDDIWHPEKLEQQRTVLMSHPKVQFIFTNFTHIGKYDTKNSDKFSSAPAGYWEGISKSLEDNVILLQHPALPSFLKFQPVFPSTMMFRRELVNDGGYFNETLGREQSEDLEFILRHDLRSASAALTRPLVAIRKHDDNLSGNNLETAMSQVRILNYLLATYPEFERFREVINTKILSCHVAAFHDAFSMKDMQRSRKIMKMIPWGSRDAKLHVKAAIANMPKPAAKIAQEFLLSKSRKETKPFEPPQS